jgi:hypothetical protein
MSRVLLNGASARHAARASCAKVGHRPAAQPEAVRTCHLAGCDIGHGIGEFDGCVKTPGRGHDEGHEIECVVHDAGQVVRVTPLPNGGRAAPLKKRAVDRLPPLISPFSRKAGGSPPRAAPRIPCARGHRLVLPQRPRRMPLSPAVKPTPDAHSIRPGPCRSKTRRTP